MFKVEQAGLITSLVAGGGGGPNRAIPRHRAELSQGAAGHLDLLRGLREGQALLEVKCVVVAKDLLGARGVGRDAIVGARPPLGGHVLQRASVDDGLKPYVSAQRGSNKH